MDFAVGRTGDPKDKMSRDGYVGAKELRPKEDRSQDDLVDGKVLGAFNGTLLTFRKRFRPGLRGDIATDEDFDFDGARLPSLGDGVNRIVIVHAFTVEAGEVAGSRFIEENPKEKSRTYKEIVEQCSTKGGTVTYVLYRVCSCFCLGGSG